MLEMRCYPVGPDDKPIEDEALAFSVFLLPGTATDEQLADVLEALSDLQVAHGGRGLAFKVPKDSQA